MIARRNMFRLILLLSIVSYSTYAKPHNEGSKTCKVGEECVHRSQCVNGIINSDTRIPRIKREITGDEGRSCNGYDQTCCSRKSDEPIYSDFEIGSCGYRNNEGILYRITIENKAEYGEFPWTVMILKKEIVTNEPKYIYHYHCVGSLIHPSVVLTAAHCVSGKNSSTLKIRVGEWDAQTEVEFLPHQDNDVSDYIIHERYNRGALFNDIALVFLTKSVQMADNVRTICLPPQNQNFDDQKCVAAGWGKDAYGKEGKYQATLNYVELPIVPRDQCVRELRKTRLGRHFQLNNSFICAGGELGRDTCKGDGGSPLVCPIPNTTNQYYQAGIVSWGIGCGSTLPAAYVNVPLFRNWIEEKFLLRRISITSFLPV